MEKETLKQSNIGKDEIIVMDYFDVLKNDGNHKDNIRYFLFEN